MKISVNEKFHFLYNKDKLDKYREIIFYGGVLTLAVFFDIIHKT